jgi:hypothetical protein
MSGIPNTAHFANVTQIEDALACKCYNLLFIIILRNSLKNDFLCIVFLIAVAVIGRVHLSSR